MQLSWGEPQTKRIPKHRLTYMFPSLERSRTQNPTSSSPHRMSWQIRGTHCVTPRIRMDGRASGRWEFSLFPPPVTPSLRSQGISSGSPFCQLVSSISWRICYDLVKRRKSILLYNMAQPDRILLSFSVLGLTVHLIHWNLFPKQRCLTTTTTTTPSLFVVTSKEERSHRKTIAMYFFKLYTRLRPLSKMHIKLSYGRFYNKRDCAWCIYKIYLDFVRLRSGLWLVNAGHATLNWNLGMCYLTARMSYSLFRRLILAVVSSSSWCGGGVLGSSSFSFSFSFSCANKADTLCRTFTFLRWRREDVLKRANKHYRL